MRVPVQIVECATRELVEAELFDELSGDTKNVAARGSCRGQTVGPGGAPGQIVPRLFHWDWSSKEGELQVLAFSFFGITCNAKLQGLMKLDLTGRAARLPAQKGKPVVYVDYLETAPWNIKALMQALGSSQKFLAGGAA